MTFDKLQVVVLTLAFLVPGFIMHSVFSLFTPRKTEGKEILALRFLTFSTLNLILCLPFIHTVIIRHYIDRHPWWTLGYFFGMTFASPVVLGCGIAYLDQVNLVRIVTRWLKIHPMHSIPTAWDYKFNELNRKGGRWVVVRLKDDRTIGGFFGSKSLASSDPSERDIYIQRAFRVEGDVWTEIPRTDGILVKGGDILAIDFVFDEAATTTPSTTPDQTEGLTPLDAQGPQSPPRADLQQDQNSGNQFS